RERERAPHRRTGLRRFEDVDGVALGDGREVSVYDRGMREDALGRQVLEPVAQPRAPLGLDELLVAGAVAVTRAAQAPLAQERRALVEHVGEVLRRQALDDPRAPERRRRDRIVEGHVRALGDLDGLLLRLALFGDALGTAPPLLALLLLA